MAQVPHPPAAKPDLEHQFNNDLLMSEEDRALAARLFPEIVHVLDHPALRSEFKKYEDIANDAKRWVHRAGIAAVLLATLALLSSAVSPLVKILHGPEWLQSLLLVGEVGGIIGTVISAGGVFSGEKKEYWLRARMMAEVLRLWHFQSMVCLAGLIEKSCGDDPAGREVFQAERDKLLHAHLHEWKNATDSKLEELVDSREPGCMLIGQTSDYTDGSAVSERIFEAYLALRFKHQLNYANHKLQKKTGKAFWQILSWPSSVLLSRTESLAVSCLLASLLVSLVIVCGHLFGWGFAHSPILPCLIITLLIVNVATRAIQDGLAVPEEVQRYYDYKGQIRYLVSRFEFEKATATKSQLMGEMERTALRELQEFLRAHDEAKFVI